MGVLWTAEWCDKSEECQVDRIVIVDGKQVKQFAETSYMPDGSCACGVQKHHYHCSHGKIIQVG